MLFSNHDGMKLEINYKKKKGEENKKTIVKYRKDQALACTLLSLSWPTSLEYGAHEGRES